jgi:hypothetical protein
VASVSDFSINCGEPTVGVFDVSGCRIEAQAYVCRHKELMQLGAGESLLTDFLKPGIVIWDDIVFFVVEILSSLLQLCLSFRVVLSW